MNRLTLLILCAAATLVACDVFDPQLYLDRDAAVADSGAGDSGSPDAAVDSGAVVLSNTCLGEPPTVVSTAEAIPVDTTGLSNNVSDVASCAGSNAPGNDGFFSVEMTAGEHWHFHVTALEPEGDPVVYVLGSGCDARGCRRGDATNNCNRQDEHFTYVAPSDGTFIVAVDDANSRGGTYTVLPVRPTCGNGLPLEHSETCERGSASCTDECTALIADGGGEVEPNDDAVGANVLNFTSGRVRGDIASQCDLASFRITAPAGSSLAAAVFTRGTSACNASAPALDLELLTIDGRTRLGSVSAGAGECPEILGTEAFASNLDGDYVLRIRPTGDEVGIYDYDLELTLAVP